MADKGLTVPELVTLIDRRKIARARYTKQETIALKHYDNAVNLQKQENPDMDSIELEVKMAETALEQLKTLYMELMDNQDEIEYHKDYDHYMSGLDAEGIRRENANDLKYREGYLNTEAKIQVMERRWNKKSSSKKSSSSRSSKKSSSKATFTPEQFAETLTTAFRNIPPQTPTPGITSDQLKAILDTITQKKRDIDIPKFKGDPQLFDQWKELVEGELSKPGYSETEKAHFVVTCLEGESQKLIAGLKDPTYEDIITVLENKYGDSMARIQKAIIEIAELEPVTGLSVKELEPFYGKLNSNWNYLLKKTEGICELKRTSWIFTALVRPKTPRTLIRRWDGEQLKEETPTLPLPFDKFLHKLHEALQVSRRTETQANKPKKDDSKSKVKNFQKERNSRPSGHALSLSTDTGRKPEADGAAVKKPEAKNDCIFCNNSQHSSVKCPDLKGMKYLDKKQKVHDSRACYNCLSRYHQIRDCKADGCRHCGQKHHQLLHFFSKESRDEHSKKGNASTSSPAPTDKKKQPESEKVKSATGLVRASNQSREILMMSGVARIESHSAVSRARVLFDTGSGVNFISNKMARKLQLKGHKVEAEFTLAGGSNMKMDTERVKFSLSSAIPNWQGEEFEIVAYTAEKPCADLNSVTIDISQFKHLQDLQIADTYPRDAAEVDVMLGIEDTTNILLTERRVGPRGTPVATKSHLGWVLSGAYMYQSNSQSIPCSLRVELKSEMDIATKHWELEHIGIMPDESQKKSTVNKQDEEAIRQHEQKTKFIDGQYETGLLKKPEYESVHLKSNRQVAVKRLEGIERWLNKDQALAKACQDQFDDLFETGRAVKVEEEYEPTDRTVWYLPHHPVVRPEKSTTKVRIVFDGSAKGPEGVSLNDTLLAGPALHPDALAVLLRFRRHKVAIVADIEKMFLCQKMNAIDQDAQRFLWRNLNSDEPPSVYKLTTVTFGLTCSPFSSIQTVMKHMDTQKEKYPKATKEIQENLFVDDILSGDDSVEEAAQLALDIKAAGESGGFRFRKFLSNRAEALSGLDEQDLATSHAVMVAGEEFTTKTLGVQYIPKEDILKFSFCDKMEDVAQETRRTILKQLHRVYDPMGMLSPFTIRAKQLFQRSWVTTGDWDDKLPPDLEKDWLSWKEEVPILDDIKVDRCLVPEDFTNPEFSLHGFGDACESSYGTAVYLRVKDLKTAKVHCTLLCSKTRVAPLKRRSIPELELMASLITARLVKYVEQKIQLPISSITCWTDSQVVMHWISQPSSTWQTFVANRVAEIQQLVPPCQWKHIPGRLNPADLCSRGISANNMVKSTLWWSGPAFLLENESEWPGQKKIEDKEAVETAKQKVKPKMKMACPIQPEPDPLAEYVEKYSSYNKFLGVMTRVRSWAKKFRAGDGGSNDPEPSAEDREEEKLFWIRWAQQSAFSEEIALLKQGKQVEKSSKLVKLNPFWDDKDQVIRVGGRLHYAVLPEETKHPIILPAHNPFVERLVLHDHITHLHIGPAQTLACLRNKYWIVRGRSEVRRIIHKCKTCKNPVKLEQQMAPLPLERTKVSASFENVGTDFAGPLFAKVKVNQDKKVWICIFSDMVTRAIHLELVQDLTTEHFIMALKRMMARRGKCRIMYSDNAKTFKKASSILLRLFKTKKNLKEQLHKHGIEWKFITERAPWHGGFYERMVGSVKRTLRRVLGKSKLTCVELETVLCEVEAQVNSRPLTAVSGATEDLSPLTPGHLVIGRVPQLLPDVDRETKETPLGKRWAYQQRLAKHFWTRWVHEYMLELNYLKKWTAIQENVRVGDIVLIAEDNQRKQEWMMGRVLEIHPGRDGLVRSVTLKTASGLRRRPIQRLRLMEAAQDESEVEDDSSHVELDDD